MLDLNTILPCFAIVFFSGFIHIAMIICKWTQNSINATDILKMTSFPCIWVYIIFDIEIAWLSNNLIKKTEIGGIIWRFTPMKIHDLMIRRKKNYKYQVCKYKLSIYYINVVHKKQRNWNKDNIRTQKFIIELLN